MARTDRRTFVLGLVILPFGLCVSSPAGAREHLPTPQDCAALTAARLEIVDEAAGEHGHVSQGAFLAKKIEPTLTSATWVPAAGSVPEYCRVEGFIATGNAREGFNRVRFGVNLPTHWNGRFVALGDGGHDGVVSTSTVRLDQGYATANSDMGHDATIFPGATFAFNNRPREIDYGWRAVHVSTVAAKGIIHFITTGRRSFPTGMAARPEVGKPPSKLSGFQTISTGSPRATCS
jgi:Tannase and feruloyl esterase